MYITDSKPRSATAGFSMVELLVTMAITGMVLSVALPMVLYSSKSFAGMATYADMNRKSVLAMDQMTRDVRQVVGITSMSSNRIVLNDGTNGALTFAFTNRALMRSQAGRSKMLLTNVDFGDFSFFQRTTISNSYNQYAAAGTNDCKLIAVRWRTSQKNPLSPTNSATEQTAKIVIRKH